MATTTEPSVCIKIRHASADAARRHQAALERYHARHGDRRHPDPLHCYQCPQCSTPDAPVWHVGHSNRRRPS